MATLEQLIDEAKKLSAEERRRFLAALERLDSNGKGLKAYPTRERERAWIAAHREEHLGKWVVENDKLVAEGSNPRQVYLAARAAGIEVPYLVRA